MEPYNSTKKFTNVPGTATKTQTVTAQKATLNCNVGQMEEGYHQPHYPTQQTQPIMPTYQQQSIEEKGNHCFLGFIMFLFLFILLFLFWHVIFDCVDFDWCKKDCSDSKRREKDCCYVLWAAFIATIVTLVFLWIIYYACTRKSC